MISAVSLACLSNSINCTYRGSWIDFIHGWEHLRRNIPKQDIVTGAAHTVRCAHRYEVSNGIVLDGEVYVERCELRDELSPSVIIGKFI